MLSRILVVLILIVVPSHLALAGNITFIKEYTYRASDIDSKVSSRAIALDQVKRILLEELGTYLLSETEVKNYQITKDQITTITAGIVMTSILDEKWNGTSYYLKAKIVADPEDVAKSVDALRKDAINKRELEAAQNKANEALREVEKLRNILNSGKYNSAGKMDYDRAIDNITASNLYYQGFASLNSRNYKEAINIFSQVIELNRNNADAYTNRGFAYNNLGLYSNALNDINRALALNPTNAKIYLLRGIVTANLNPPASPKELSSSRYHKLVAEPNPAVVRQNEDNIVANYDKAIQLDSLYAEAYYYKGKFYCSRSTKYKYETVEHGYLGVDSTVEPTAYTDTELFNKCIANIRIAAKLEHKKAQEELGGYGLSWQ